MKYLYFFVIAIFLSSCAFHSGIVTSNAPSVHRNMKYVNIAAGYSKASYFFGLGGVKKDLLISNAKQKLLASYSLKPNQSFENFTLNLKKTCFGPVIKMEAVMISDVVEYDSSYTVSYEPNYLNWLPDNSQNGNRFFKLGEIILFKEGVQSSHKGKIIAMENNKAVIIYKEETGELKTKQLSFFKIYKISDIEAMLKELWIMNKDSYRFISDDRFGWRVAGEGKIIGINPKKALIQSKRYEYRVSTNTLRKLNP